jgi:hypothetical protein
VSEELPPSERPPETPRRSWEEEKEREKEQEKEMEKAEKPAEYDEKVRRSPLAAVFWAGILVWAGLVLMADNLGYLPEIGEAEAWNWILAGVGVLLLLEALVRAASPDYARPTTGRFIWAGVIILVGLSGIISFELVWPLILVVAGVAVLFSVLLRR